MKVVINASIGGFEVSRAVYERLGAPWSHWLDDLPVDDEEERRDWPILLYVTDPALRSNSALVAAVEELGGAAAGGDSTVLKVVEIPDGIEWHVCVGEDGREWIAEDHRTWS